MPSPFPGMDPYIENPNVFSDFHGTLATEIRNALNRVMQPRYVAQIIQRVTYEIVEIGETHGTMPDVGVWHDPRIASAFSGAAMVTTAPTAVNAIENEYASRIFAVEIREVDSMRLVTHIEILSPSNKRAGEQYDEYRGKRRDILRSAAHFVEIDLLRSGTRQRLERPVPSAPYFVTISRSDERPRVEIWSIQMQDPLPVLPIPLLDPDPDAPLHLGLAVTNVYDSGRYATRIDYRNPPPPPKLSSQESDFVNTLLKPLREHA